MNDKKSALVLAALDECLEKYIAERRLRVDGFIERHFSIKETIEIQKKSFTVDLLLNPLNALWSIPYLSIKKTIETLDKIGLPQLTPAIDKIPAGIKTGYQKEIERLIGEELVDSNSLIKELKDNPVLGNLLEAEQLSFDSLQLGKLFSEEIDKYSSSQAMISDLSGTLLTLFTGWLFFGDKTLSISGLGQHIARKMARDQATSHFILGKNLGSTFYRIFPPEPTRIQVYTATITVGFMLTALTLITGVLCDPLRKKLGLHKKKLNTLVDNLEGRLFLHIKKEIKKSSQMTSQIAEAS